MKNFVKVVLLASSMVAGVAYADGFRESDYPFVPNAVSPSIGQKVEQISLTDSDYPGILINSGVAREVVMQELVDYNRVNPYSFYSY